MITAGLFGFKKTVVSEPVAAQLHVSGWYVQGVPCGVSGYCTVTQRYTWFIICSSPPSPFFPSPPLSSPPLQLVYTYDLTGVTRHLRPLDLPLECGGQLDYDHHQWLLHKLVSGVAQQHPPVGVGTYPSPKSLYRPMHTPLPPLPLSLSSPCPSSPPPLPCPSPSPPLLHLPLPLSSPSPPPAPPPLLPLPLPLPL